ncbi:MaoC family dehydratase [Streptomyces fuscichromogenes]|uniref:Acyl dehydratase n=1 Tax=Streptomyces fuscichromogenes TaxID=1324013 RepID=A0A917XFL1_9ACTN|nr:MaoC family dehydratase [Streptomyces fuscichromogenes]GGN19970.1 acyl dehydratase [Streptomyces fuscichromogenes]
MDAVIPKGMARIAEGPYFEELAVGQVFDGAPALTLTSGHAATHQSIVGDRLALPLDEELSRAVTGRAPLAHPALVWDVAIGQSTLATHHVKANLFYRGLVLRRSPLIGDTLWSSTEVVALRRNTVRPGRRPTGLAALRITTTDQFDRPVLDFWRCAMLPLRDTEAGAEHVDDLDSVGEAPDVAALAAVAQGWRLDRFARRVAGPRCADLAEGMVIEVGGGDVVSGAPELARLTLNVAMVHHDRHAAGGRRLVYGGHTIGVALAQAARALPSVVTVAGWHGCDHLGPVHEGDTLYSTVVVERLHPLGGHGGLAQLRSLVRAVGADGPDREVLDWRYAVVLA